MKQLVTSLSNAINNDLHIPIISREITVSENNIHTSCKKVTFKSTSENIFAFSLDYKFKEKIKIFPFFDQSLANITKVNDCIIFYVIKNKIHIFLVELKSNNLSDYKIQLQAGKNFVHYLNNMMNLVFQKNYFIDEKDIKCLVFTTRNMPQKQGTKKTNIEYENINGLNISYHPCGSTFQLDKFT